MNQSEQVETADVRNVMRLVPHKSEEAGSTAIATPDAAAPLWPPEVDMILSAMDVGVAICGDRRAGDRSPHHTRAELRLFAHDPLSPPTPLYTRDISPAGIGFITRDRLPLGYGGIVKFEQEDGTTISASCTIVRCRASINGWYEGGLQFTN